MEKGGEKIEKRVGKQWKVFSRKERGVTETDKGFRDGGKGIR